MKTTPKLGLKLYDGTDAPDLVSGYNASMSTLDDARLFRFANCAPDGTDLNTLTQAGQYTLIADNTYSNLPADAVLPVCLLVYDRCETEGTSSCVTQLALPTPSATSGQCMLRSYTANLKWSDWVPVARPEVAWADVTGKPFDTVGTSLTTSGNVLDLSTAAQASLVPEGGEAGQVLVKNSDTDHNVGWRAPSTLAGNVCANADGSLLLQGAAMGQLQLSDGSGASAALTSSSLTMRNDGGTTSYTVGANGKGILNNITMINGDLPLKVGEEFKLKSNVIGADYKAMSAAFGFDGFNPAIGMGVLRLGSQGVQATCAVRVEASLVGSNLFTIYAVVFEPFINKHTTGFYMSGSATTTSTVDSNIDWGDSIYLTPLTKLKA